MDEAVCEEAYGFLPCSNSFGGSISLILVYGYILLKGAECISNGSEYLLEVGLSLRALKMFCYQIAASCGLDLVGALAFSRSTGRCSTLG